MCDGVEAVSFTYPPVTDIAAFVLRFTVCPWSPAVAIVTAVAGNVTDTEDPGVLLGVRVRTSPLTLYDDAVPVFEMLPLRVCWATVPTWVWLPLLTTAKTGCVVTVALLIGTWNVLSFAEAVVLVIVTAMASLVDTVNELPLIDDDDPLPLNVCVCEPSTSVSLPKFVFVFPLIVTVGVIFV